MIQLARARTLAANGYINNHLYEQHSINEKATNISVAFNKALDHAVDKGATIAVVNDKHNKTSEQDMINGIRQFTSFPRNDGKVKSLFLVTHDKHLVRKEIKQRHPG